MLVPAPRPANTHSLSMWDQPRGGAVLATFARPSTGTPCGSRVAGTAPVGLRPTFGREKTQTPAGRPPTEAPLARPSQDPLKTFPNSSLLRHH